MAIAMHWICTPKDGNRPLYYLSQQPLRKALCAVKRRVFSTEAPNFPLKGKLLLSVKAMCSSIGARAKEWRPAPLDVRDSSPWLALLCNCTDLEENFTTFTPHFPLWYLNSFRLDIHEWFIVNLELEGSKNKSP